MLYFIYGFCFCPVWSWSLPRANARRYFVLLVKSNFDDGDFHIVLTYNDERRPKTIEAAEHEVALFIDRLRTLYRKHGVKKVEYVFITFMWFSFAPNFITHIQAGCRQAAAFKKWAYLRGKPLNYRLLYANKKSARRYFVLLVKSNFDDGDFHVVLTYNDNRQHRDSLSKR